MFRVVLVIVCALLFVSSGSASASAPPPYEPVTAEQVTVSADTDLTDAQSMVTRAVQLHETIRTVCSRTIWVQAGEDVGAQPDSCTITMPARASDPHVLCEKVTDAYETAQGLTDKGANPHCPPPVTTDPAEPTEPVEPVEPAGPVEPAEQQPAAPAPAPAQPTVIYVYVPAPEAAAQDESSTAVLTYDRPVSRGKTRARKPSGRCASTSVRARRAKRGSCKRAARKLAARRVGHRSR